MSRLKQRLVATGAAILGMLSLGAVVASPAQAAPGNCYASSYRICWFVDANFKGRAGWETNWGAPVSIRLLPADMNDKVSSIVINSGDWCFYEHADFQGNKYQVNAGWAVSQVPSYINDKISSVKPGWC